MTHRRYTVEGARSDTGDDVRITVEAENAAEAEAKARASGVLTSSITESSDLSAPGGTVHRTGRSPSIHGRHRQPQSVIKSTIRYLGAGLGCLLIIGFVFLIANILYQTFVSDTPWGERRRDGTMDRDVSVILGVVLKWGAVFLVIGVLGALARKSRK